VDANIESRYLLSCSSKDLVEFLDLSFVIFTPCLVSITGIKLY
jgi:hypothetical protein